MKPAVWKTLSGSARHEVHAFILPLHPVLTIKFKSMNKLSFYNVFYFALSFVVLGMFSSCGKSKQNQSIIPEGLQKSIEFRNAASASPITETQLVDDFHFGMSEEQFDEANLKHEQTSFMTRKYIIGGIEFMGRASGSFSNGKDMYELDIVLEKRCDNGNSVTLQDFNSIVDAQKVTYGDKFVYLSTEEPAKKFPTHYWRKDNLLIKIEANFEHSNHEILLQYTNMPVMHAIQEKIRIKDKERNDRREKAIMASGGVEITNSSYDGSVSQVKDYLRKNLKDPKSYEGIEWGKLKEEQNGYSVYHKYRAKNSFGGYVIEAQVFYLDFGGNVIRVQDVE